MTSFWYFYWYLWTYFIPFSGVSSVGLEQENVNWVYIYIYITQQRDIYDTVVFRFLQIFYGLSIDRSLTLLVMLLYQYDKQLSIFGFSPVMTTLFDFLGPFSTNNLYKLDYWLKSWTLISSFLVTITMP